MPSNLYRDSLRSAILRLTCSPRYSRTCRQTHTCYSKYKIVLQIHEQSQRHCAVHKAWNNKREEIKNKKRKIADRASKVLALLALKNHFLSLDKGMSRLIDTQWHKHKMLQMFILIWHISFKNQGLLEWPTGMKKCIRNKQQKLQLK